MDVYGNLEVDLGTVAFDDLIGAATAIPSSRWFRDTDLEKELSTDPDFRQSCFTFLRDERFPEILPANVWLARRRDRQMAYVSNILSRKKSSLTADEYNDIRDVFAVDVMEPAASSLGLVVRLSKRNPALEDLVNAQTAAALRSFSGSANKSTGSSHPMDKDRWNRFVILHFENRDSLGTDLLFQWLAGEGWDDETANRLVIEFEQGLGLLSAYTRRG